MKFKKLSVLGLTLSLLLVCGVTAAFATVPAQPVLQAADPAEAPNAGSFYKTEEGELVKLDDEDVVICTTITVDEDGNITVSGDLPDGAEGGLIWAGGFALDPADSGLTPVDPDSVDLSEMEEYLAKKVADGELTREEADQMLADVAEMLEQARNGGISMWMVMDGDCEGAFLAGSTSTFGGEDIAGDVTA